MGKIEIQTPEIVQLAVAGGSRKTYSTTAFLNQNPLNLSRNFSVRVTLALIDQVSAAITAGAYGFAPSGSAVKFPGFMALYRIEDEDNGNNGEKSKEQLPPLAPGDRLRLQRLEPRQHFTQPPPRFSEASLVKELEENGIGRPSTYAAILSTIRDKGYVELLRGYFRPSELGLIVNDLRVMNFPDIFDVEFTARLEESLDQVESDQANSLELLTRFYQPFRKDLLEE